MINKINLKEIEEIAKNAGLLIMEIYQRDFEIEYKDDKSPLTEADKVSNEYICEQLTKLNNVIPILSEENKECSFEERRNWNYYWCIDPIDGTKEFIKKNGEFTINIALIHKTTPILGVVYSPVLDVMYSSKLNEGAYKNGKKLPLSKKPEKYIIVASKSHMSEETQEFISSIETSKKKELISMGSSLKLCLVAEGVADCYPRIAPTMEWDTAAAHAIVKESGKNVYKYKSEEVITYNKENLLNPSFIVR